MNNRSDEVFQECYSFSWKTDILEHKVREINFGSFHLILELQPNVCQSMVYIFLYDKGQSHAALDIKTYMLNNEGKEEFLQLYKGSLRNGPTIWSMKRCELLENGYITCTSESVTFRFEIGPVVEASGDENSIASSNSSFRATTVKDEIKHEEKEPTSLEKMSHDFGKLCDNEENSNVILKCAERQIKAHRCILSARSDVFAAMFRSAMLESQKGIVTIEDVAPETLQRMLRYIYSGKVEELTVEMASELYKAADQYDIGSLKDRCVSVLVENLSQTSVCDVFLIADAYNDEQLGNSAIDFMAKNSAFLCTNVWNTFCEEHPSMGIKVYRKYQQVHYKTEQQIPKVASQRGFNFGATSTAFGTLSSQFGSSNSFTFGSPSNDAVTVSETENIKGYSYAASEEPHPSDGPQEFQQASRSVVSINTIEEEESPPSLEKMSLDFGKLFDNEVESDVVLTCADRRIKAHRCILSSRCDIFATMLSEKLENNKEDVIIKDLAPDTLEQVLRYIYSGKVEQLTVETATELYKAAHQYGIGELKKQCVSFLTKNLSQDSACNVLLLADTYSDEQLQCSTMDFMVKNRQLFSTDQWIKLCEKHPSVGIKVYKNYVKMYSQNNTGLIFK